MQGSATSGLPQAPEANKANVPVGPQQTEQRTTLLYEGMIKVEPYSKADSYKRSHNTLFEALRILVVAILMIVLSFVTIPYRICRKSWTNPSKPSQPKLEKDLV